jgi:outer membrane protein TolC
MKAVLAEATDAAVAVLYWQERIALERQFRDLAEQAAEIRRELFQINEVPYRDTVATEMALADALLAERDAATRLRLAQLRLARAMGVDPVNAPALCGRLEAAPLPPIPLETVLDCARNAAPELVQADCDVAASRAQLAYEKWRTLPDLTIGPRYRHAFSDDPEGIGARVEVDLPVFDWNQANIAASAAQLQSNAARSRMAELATVGDVAELYLELRAVDADLEYYTRQLLPMAERATTTLQQAFRERAVGAAELVDLLQQAGRIRKSHLDLRWQHVRLRARLEVLLEQPLSELAADAAGDPVPIPADHAATVE